MSDTITLPKSELEQIVERCMERAIRKVKSDEKVKKNKTHVTRYEAMELLKCKKDKFAALCAEGHFKTKQVGRRTLYSIESINDFLNQ